MSPGLEIAFFLIKVACNQKPLDYKCLTIITHIGIKQNSHFAIVEHFKHNGLGCNFNLKKPVPSPGDFNAA